MREKHNYMICAWLISINTVLNPIILGLWLILLFDHFSNGEMAVERM